MVESGKRLQQRTSLFKSLEPILSDQRSNGCEWGSLRLVPAGASPTIRDAVQFRRAPLTSTVSCGASCPRSQREHACSQRRQDSSCRLSSAFLMPDTGRYRTYQTKYACLVESDHRMWKLEPPRQRDKRIAICLSNSQATKGKQRGPVPASAGTRAQAAFTYAACDDRDRQVAKRCARVRASIWL